MSNKPSRIVILGGGFAGAYCAQKLNQLLSADEADVLLIDRNNFFVFYPLLVEAGTGSLEPRHAVVPIRAFLKRGRFHMGEVTSVDVEEHRVEYALSGDDSLTTAEFDHLVIAAGGVTNWPDVPGLREHGFEIKSLADAVSLRDRAIRMLERANATDDEALKSELLHFVVVGANFTGAEVAGEFDMFLKRAAKSYAHVNAAHCRISLIELSDRILAPLGPELSDFATQALRKRNVDVVLNTTIAEMRTDGVTLTDGRELRTHTVIWCAGIAPSSLLDAVDVPRDDRGYVLCERDLRVCDQDAIWAIGDCAVNPDRNGKPYPATAQHAVREGTHAARNIAAVIRGGTTRPCDIVSQGSLAALGCRTGVAIVLGIRLSGFWAWWLWRTVYLLKMPGLSRKIRVALDWTIDLFFRPDLVQLGVHRPKRPDVVGKIRPDKLR